MDKNVAWRIEQQIKAIQATMKRPGDKPLTSRQMWVRANMKRSMVTGIKLSGGEVRKEYE
jgi:hypothetical protein